MTLRPQPQRRAPDKEKADYKVPMKKGATRKANGKPAVKTPSKRKAKRG